MILLRLPLEYFPPNTPDDAIRFACHLCERIIPDGSIMVALIELDGIELEINDGNRKNPELLISEYWDLRARAVSV